MTESSEEKEKEKEKEKENAPPSASRNTKSGWVRCSPSLLENALFNGCVIITGVRYMRDEFGRPFIDLRIEGEVLPENPDDNMILCKVNDIPAKRTFQFVVAQW